MATPEDCDHQLLARSERIGEARVGEGMDWSVATEGEPVAGDVGEQCSRVEVVEDDAEVEGPAAYGGDDGDHSPQIRRAPLCNLHSVDGPSR